MVLLDTIYKCDSTKEEADVIDHRAINKDELQGRLDNTALF